MTADDARKTPDPRSETDPEKGGRTKYDKPARPEDDTATDERRDKPIRGPEPWQRE